MLNFFPIIILTYLECFRQVFSKPNFKYFKAFIIGLFLVEGKKCITKIHNACFFLNKHFSSFERFFSESKWDINKVIELTIRKLIEKLKEKLKICGAYLVAIDTTYVAKNSKKMIGIQKWLQHSSNSDRGDYLIGHHWSIAGLVCNFCDKFFCLPILSRLISGNKNVSHYVCDNKGIKNMGFFDTAISTAYQIKEYLNGEVFRTVADAYYSKSIFIQALLDKGIHVISRLRKDAVGWEEPCEYSGRGRPRKYGKKWKLSELINLPEAKEISVNIYGKVCGVKAVCKDLLLRDVKEKVLIVVVEGLSDPVIFISTDLSLTMNEVIEIYSHRFSIEIAIRDLKHNFGLGDYQFRTTLSIFRFVQLCCIAFSFWRLVMFSNIDTDWLLESHSDTTMNETFFSFSRVRRLFKTFIIKKILFFNFGVDTDLEKMNNEYKFIFKMIT